MDKESIIYDTATISDIPEQILEDPKENVKFYTEKCDFYIASTERDGDVTHARFVLER